MQLAADPSRATATGNVQVDPNEVNLSGEAARGGLGRALTGSITFLHVYE